jgi:hypothetical protein
MSRPYINPLSCFIDINIKNTSRRFDIGESQKGFCEEFDVVTQALNTGRCLYRIMETYRVTSTKEF